MKRLWSKRQAQRSGLHEKNQKPICEVNFDRWLFYVGLARPTHKTTVLDVHIFLVLYVPE